MSELKERTQAKMLQVGSRLERERLEGELESRATHDEKSRNGRLHYIYSWPQGLVAWYLHE